MNDLAALVVAGTSSGVGKTSLTLGLARALSRRSLRVQPFKVGPDFLDPTYLARATGRTCYNLDGWMTERRYVQQLFTRQTVDADVALIEGVMGLFDGADPTSLTGSTAEIAAWLDAPVLLIVDAHGMARSLAAVVRGFVNFEPRIRIAGVVANRSGSARHRQWLADALHAAGLPPLLGAVPRDAFPALESRHLGLATADDDRLPDAHIAQLADTCEQHVDINAIAQLAHTPSRSVSQTSPPERRTKTRIAVAHDAAFHFTYQDNLEALKEHGAEIVFFSPLADRSLPERIGGLYLPGGYPELFAEALAANRSMLTSIRSVAESGACLYAECGGLMYLGRAILLLDGSRQPMVGTLPIVTRMRDHKKSLGYVEATFRRASFWGDAGTTIRGHEFHYSEIIEDHTEVAGWQSPYDLRRRRSETAEPAGFQKGNILAGYPHLHWAARADTVQRFLRCCEVDS